MALGRVHLNKNAGPIARNHEFCYDADPVCIYIVSALCYLFTCTLLSIVLAFDKIKYTSRSKATGFYACHTPN